MFNLNFNDQIDKVSLKSLLSPVLAILVTGHHGKNWLEQFDNGGVPFKFLHPGKKNLGNDANAYIVCQVHQGIGFLKVSKELTKLGTTSSKIHQLFS